LVARTWFNAEVDTWTGADARRLRRVALRMSLREFADHLGVSHRTVSKWEQAGAAREPRPHMQAILDTALAKADDAAKARFAQAGASNDLPDKPDGDHPSPDTPRRGRTPAPDRRQFLQTLGAVGAVGMGASLDGIAHELEALAPRATVSEADIARLRSAGDFFSSWSHAHGSEQIGHAVSSEMSRAANLLKLPCPPRLRPGLLAAVAQLGVATGALLFDSHQHQLADRVLAFATACAEDGGDWHLRAKSLSWRARQAVWVGDAEGALTLAELGLVRHDRLTATEQAMLFSAVARAHGRRGDVDATLQAVGEADDAFARVDPCNDVPWMAYYDYAQHCGDTGHALAELAVHGVRVEDTTRRLATAVAQHPDTYIRSRAISGFKLAALTMQTGDPDHAVEIAKGAVGDAAGVLSKRLHRTAMEIAQSARLHQHDQRDQVAEVLETVRTVGVVS
jgi:transcriptional regulator with XRE-family HTH domain